MPAGNWPSWSRQRSGLPLYDRKCRVGKAKRAHASTPRRMRRTRDAPGDLRVGTARKRLPAHQHRITRLCPPYGSWLRMRRDGAAEGIRTPDPRITNAVLYRLSYRGRSGRSDIGCAPPWQGRLGGRSGDARVPGEHSETRDPGRYGALFAGSNVRVALGPGSRSPAGSHMNGRAGALAWPGHVTPPMTQHFSRSHPTT
jgi:hypothetical protein